MYKCPDCKNLFDEPDYITETHGFRYGPFEQLPVCPHCGGDGYEEIETNEN